MLAAVLVAAPLYVSSVGSAALQRQFDERCPARIGLVLPDTSSGGVGAVSRAAARHLDGARNLAEPVRTTRTPFPLDVEDLDAGVADGVRLLHRPGALDDIEVVDGPSGDDGGGDGGVWIPASWAEEAGFDVGDTVRLTAEVSELPGTITFELAVAAVYRDLVSQLPPAPWCLESDILRPTSNGDPPPPLLLLDDAAADDLPVPLVLERTTVAERIPIERAGLTMGIASDLVTRFEPAREAARDAALAVFSPFARIGQFEADSELPAVLARAGSIQDLVRANVRPVQAAGALAGVVLSVTAGLLAARRRQAELTTRTVRGEGPVRLAGRLVVAGALPVVGGVAAGAVASHLAVRAVGPSADLGPALGSIVVWSAVAVVLAGIGVAVGGAAVVRGLVDARPVTRHRRLPWRLVPWELVVVPVVVIAGRRLDDVGGPQFRGNETTGVDALAVTFPVLVAVAVAVLLLRPIAFVCRRLRRAGSGADPAAFLALRRLAHDPISAAATTAAVVLAVATATVGGALSASAEAAVDDKAETFVGARSAATLAGQDRMLPSSLDGLATLTVERQAESGDQRAVMLGIDPATFADGAAVGVSEQRLVDRLAAASAAAGIGGDGDSGDSGEPVPAIVVGRLPSAEVTFGSRGAIVVDPIAHPATFPTARSTTTLIVVDAAALADATATTIVLSGLPVAELEALLRDDGQRITGVNAVEELVLGTSRAAVRWAYAALRALGAVVVAVLVGVQLARSAARARQRRLAEVFTAAMGLGRRRAALAEVIEQGLPVVTGLAAGLVVALLTAEVAVPDLDSARGLPPRASLVVPVTTVVLVTVVALVALAVVVAGARRQARRARAAVVLRE